VTEAFDCGSSAVLLMAYGGPDCLEAVGPFMCDLTGREPGPEMLARVQARYASIGGKSPLPEIAQGFAGALEASLARGGCSVPVAVGFKYTHPKIGDVLAGLHERGIRSVVGVSLSPFESKSTSTAYEGAVSEALPGLPGMRVEYAPALGELPEFAAAHAVALAEALGRVRASRSETLVVFTAHSLPVADLETPERYITGLRRVASHLAEEAGWSRGTDFAASELLGDIASFGALEGDSPWMLAYQSKGMRPGEWLGPDLADVMAAAAAAGIKAVVVSPIGFATEHMETRYDLDVVEADRASGLGIEFARGAAPNSHPALVGAVSSAVVRAMGHRE